MNIFLIVVLALASLVTIVTAESFSCKYKDGSMIPVCTQAPDGTWCNNIPLGYYCNMCLVLMCMERSNCSCKCSGGATTCTIPPGKNLTLGDFISPSYLIDI